MSQSEPSPLVSLSTPASTDPGVKFTAILCLTGFSLAISLCATWGVWRDGHKVAASSNQATAYVIVDSRAIITAKTRQVLTASNNVNPSTEGRKFGQQLDNELKKLTDQGIVVISRDAVVASPADIDLTEEIARRLDVNLQYNDNKFVESLKVAHDSDTPTETDNAAK